MTSITSSSKDYYEYCNTFNMSSLLTEIFGGYPEDRLNAYMACCGRHIRAGQGNKIALVHEDTANNITRISFDELDKASAQVANLLQSYGVKVGDQVATMLPRTPELLIIVLATWRIGAVYQPLFTAFGYDSIKYRMNKAKTKVVFTNSDNRSKFADLAQQAKMVLVGKRDEAQKWPEDDYNESVAQQAQSFEPVVLDTDAPFLQMFTSGTVGKSKGVSVPLAALPAFYLYMRYAIDLQESDNYWNMADPGWAYGLYYAITGPLLLGMTTHFNEAGFDATDTRDFMLRHNITNLASSPTAFRMMKSSGVFKKATDDDINNGTGNKDQQLLLRVANSAGETLNTEVVGWVESHLGCKVCDQYGQTETGMTCCEHHALEHKCPVGSMGMALPGHRLVVLDEDMQVLPDGEQGQLAVVVSQSPAFYFRGYSWNEKQAFVDDYYLTGDVVERHSDGTYWFSGRDDDIITTAGYRVGPTDVENTVLEHEAVAESAAVGIADEARGHIIKSYVVLKEGVEGNDELAEQIKALVRERLSAHAYPRQVEFVDSLPKTPSGKIQRFLLRSLADS